MPDRATVKDRPPQVEVTASIKQDRKLFHRFNDNTRHRGAVFALRFLLLGALLALWQYFGTSSPAAVFTISSPGRVAVYLGNFLIDRSTFGTWSDLSTTTEEAAGGFIIGVVAGIFLACCVGLSHQLRAFIAPFISMANALPKIALAPLFIIFFGNSYGSKTYFVASVIFFLSFYNVYVGLGSIDPIYIRNAKVLGANRKWVAKEVYFPSIVGWIATSLRLSASFALAAAIVSEYLGSNHGLGYIIYSAQEASNPTVVVGVILIIAIVAVLVDRIIVRVQRHFSRWRLP